MLSWIVQVVATVVATSRVVVATAAVATVAATKQDDVRKEQVLTDASC